MRIVHISDLHLGKCINGLSLIEQGDQTKWVRDFIESMRQIKPDAIVIAGDIYDRSNPSAEATELLDHMLTELSKMRIPTMLIAGNHDSGRKLGFASELLEKEEIGIYISGVTKRELKHITLEDEYGPVTFWLMPYTFPALVGSLLNCESGVSDYNSAIKALLEVQDIDKSVRNVLVAHQNVVCKGIEAVRGGSETMVGGVGEIEYTTFDQFDYVALGHIHAAYHVGRESVRFSGSPMCYHFDEVKQAKKGPILVEIGHKDEEIKVEVINIEPLHPLREIRGTYEDICKELEGDNRRGEYVKVVVTDCRTTSEMNNYLKTLLEGRESRLLEIISEYREFKPVSEIDYAEAEEKPVEEYFADLYRERKDDAGPDEADEELFEFIGQLVRDNLDKGNTNPSEEDTKKLIEFVTGQEDE